MYLHTKSGCDRSIVVGCRSRNDRQTSRHPDKQNGMTLRLTLRDVTQQTNKQTDRTKNITSFFGGGNNGYKTIVYVSKEESFK